MVISDPLDSRQCRRYLDAGKGRGERCGFHVSGPEDQLRSAPTQPTVLGARKDDETVEAFANVVRDPGMAKLFS